MQNRLNLAFAGSPPPPLTPAAATSGQVPGATQGKPPGAPGGKAKPGKDGKSASAKAKKGGGKGALNTKGPQAPDVRGKALQKLALDESGKIRSLMMLVKEIPGQSGMVDVLKEAEVKYDDVFSKCGSILKSEHAKDQSAWVEVVSLAEKIKEEFAEPVAIAQETVKGASKRAKKGADGHT